MTLSLAAVCIPVLFMGGILGRLLHEFAVTIGVAILVSGFVSLSLTPMMCSRFLRPPATEEHGRIYAASERVFEGMRSVYDATLKVVLRHRLATMVVSGVILVVTIHLFKSIPKGFLPSEDTGQIFGFTEGAQGISFQDMARHQQEVAKILLEDPNIESLSSSIGVSTVSVAANAGRVFVRLKPRSQRRLSADEIIQELRPKLAQVPGIQVFLQNLPPIRIGGQFTKSLYQYTLQSPDTQELYRAAPALEAKLSELPELQDVTSDLQLKNPQVNVDIDRDKASALGLSVSQVEEALYTSYGSRQVSTIYAPNNQYRVIMELEPQFQSDPASISLLYVRSPVRWVWRPGGFDDLPHGSEHLRIRRCDHARGDREEERDHDDRFRTRSAAKGGKGAAGGDIPGVPGPVPPHNDDDHGGPDGDAADRARPRRGRGVPAPSGSGSRRRPALLPACHAVPDPCLLH